MSRVSLVLLALLAVLLPTLAAAAPGGRALGPLPAPDALGPFAVGHTSFDATDASRSGRTLPIDVWYPVDPDDAVGPATAYPVLPAGFLGLPGVDLVSEVAVEGAPASAAGPFPLVVFSHGSGGVRFQSAFLAEQLASHGFVVAAPDHVGNTAFDAFLGTADPFPVVALDRPADVSFVIDVVLARSADPGDLLAGRVDPDRIGVAGHSFGAFTTLAVASGYANALGAVPPDPRVDVLVPISPAAGLLSDDDLARVDLPTLVLGGTADVTTPIVPNSVRAFTLPTARPRYRVDVLEAGHASFTDVCGFRDAILASSLPPPLVALLIAGIQDSIDEGCAPELIPVEEAHRLTNLYVVAFLSRHLEGDPRFARFLTPGRVASRMLAVDYFQVPGRGR
jgi:predicted dienelactone hydrolase